jgi:hypothetical protein
MNRILNTLKILLKILLKDLFETDQINLIRNINYQNGLDTQQKVLISYTTNVFYSDLDTGLGRTIPYEMIEIIKVFSNLNYCIDIIDCRDISKIKYIKNVSYNLIFGFGEVFYQMVNLQPMAISILYMTEHHPDFSLTQESLRNQYFFERKKKRITISRSGRFYKSAHVQKKYDHIITMGETEPFAKQYEVIHTIFPTGIINKSFIFTAKDHSITRKHFLWLGSTGFVHKGLDLLVDVFKDRDDIYLHICGLSEIERKFINIPNQPNIIDYGHIDIHSSVFLDIVSNCTFITLPSCSEGFSTAITTGMLHGLIPIVMKDIGFNRLNDKAIFLLDFKIPYLTAELMNISNIAPYELQLKSEVIFNWANNTFILSQFYNNFKLIIDKMLC